MMQRRQIPTPEDVKGITTGGFWFLCEGTGARATIYWYGGPKSPDKDIVLHNIVAEFPGTGAGTLLLHEILAWCDERGLSISCLAPAERTAWLQRIGFTMLEQRYGDVVMGRPPVPALR